MFTAIRHYLSVMRYHARITLLMQLEYPVFLISWILMIPIQYFGGIWLIQVIINKFQSLAGWSFPEIAFLYGVGLLSMQLQVIFCIHTWYIGRLILRGGFDRFLLRPMGTFFLFITSYFNVIGLIGLITAVVIFAYACNLVAFVWSVSNILKLIILVISAAFIRNSIFLSFGSIAFWHNNKDALNPFLIEMMERTTLYPINIYPEIIQFLLVFIIPIGFVNFYPVAEFIGKDTGFILPVSPVMATAVVSILCFFVSKLIFKAGLRKYESVGN